MRGSASSYEDAVAACIDSAGNVIVVGETSGSVDGFSNLGGDDVLTVKYDSNGNWLWTDQGLVGLLM